MKAKKSKAPVTVALPSVNVADELFDTIVQTFIADKAVTQARMFGSTGLKANGKVFAMVVKGKLVVKLPKARVDALVAKGDGEYFDPGHGRLMKEWVAIKRPDKLFWLKLVQEAWDFIVAGR